MMDYFLRNGREQEPRPLILPDNARIDRPAAGGGSQKRINIQLRYIGDRPGQKRKPLQNIQQRFKIDALFAAHPREERIYF